MYRIIDDRGTGKTSRLMLLAKENNATFVCSNPRAMEYKAKQYGIDGLEFISYGEFNDYGADKYIIDELDHYLTTTLGTGLIGYSITNE